MPRTKERQQRQQENRLARHPNGICTTECQFSAHGIVSHYRAGCRCEDCVKTWRTKSGQATIRFKRRNSLSWNIREWAKTRPEFDKILRPKGRVPAEIVEAYNKWNAGEL